MLLHFIWINKSLAFGEGEYMSLLSALKNTSYNILLHTNLLSNTNKEWNPYSLLDNYKERFEIIYTEFEEEFEGVKPKIASISDIYRIRILKEYGGAYSDLDMLWIKNLPEALLSTRYATSWENQSYKTVQNAFIYMEKGLEEVDQLLEEFKRIFEEQKRKGKVDLSNSKRIKDHMLLYHATADFSKKMCQPFHRNYLFKNGWRRIGRACRQQGLPTKDSEQKFGSTKDKLNIKDICALHWGNSIFNWSSIKQLKELQDIIKELQK